MTLELIPTIGAVVGTAVLLVVLGYGAGYRRGRREVPSVRIPSPVARVSRRRRG